MMQLFQSLDNSLASYKEYKLTGMGLQKAGDSNYLRITLHSASSSTYPEEGGGEGPST